MDKPLDNQQGRNMEINYRVGYREKNQIFEITFLKINEKTVIDCHRTFRECFEQNFKGQEFKILFDARGYRHDCLVAERAMRELYSSGTWKPEEYAKYVACAIVNDDYPRMEYMIQSTIHEKERFFGDIDSALVWLSTLHNE
jgi:hypothetical protein